MDLTHVLLSLAALWVLYLAAVTLDRVKRLSAQLAVLTMRVSDLNEIIDALDTRLRTELERGY